MENMMRNRFCTVPVIAIVGLLAGLPASSANTFYNSSTNYSESKTTTTCGTNNTCSLAFRKVAATKTLMITHVSCLIVAKSTVAPLTRAVLTDNNGQVRESLTPVLLSTDGQDVQYFQSSNEANTVFLGATTATTPQVTVTFDGSIQIQELSCTLAGQYL
jgi:hypothetical protein